MWTAYFNSVEHFDESSMLIWHDNDGLSDYGEQFFFGTINGWLLTHDTAHEEFSFIWTLYSMVVESQH